MALSGTRGRVWSRSTPRPTSSPATRSSRRSSAASPPWRPPPAAISRRCRRARIAASGRTVAEEITQAIAVIGENINLRRTAYLEVPQGVVAGYLHNAAGTRPRQDRRAGGAESPADAGAVAEIGKQLAMHVAAANPQAVSVDGSIRR